MFPNVLKTISSMDNPKVCCPPQILEESQNIHREERKKAKNTSLAAKGALANRLQRRTACKIQNGRQGPQNGRGGLERCLPLGFWAF